MGKVPIDSEFFFREIGLINGELNDFLMDLDNKISSFEDKKRVIEEEQTFTEVNRLQGILIGDYVGFMHQIRPMHNTIRKSVLRLRKELEAELRGSGEE